MSSSPEGWPATPVVGIPLEYDRHPPPGWAPVIRLMALATLGQGGAVVLGFTSTIFRIVSTGARLGGGVDVLALLVELIRAGVGVGLIVAGWTALQRWRFAWTLVGILEVAVAAAQVIFAGFTILQYHIRYAAFSARPPYLYLDVQMVTSLCAQLVLPALLWMFSRQPEVRSSPTVA